METATNQRGLRDIKRFTKVLDTQFKLPGTNFRFGLDPILGLVPGAGDVLSYVLSGGLVVAMARNGASGQVVTKMVINVVLDTIIGAIPLIGTLWDFTYKANSRNLRLLQEHYEEGKYKGSAKGVLLKLIIVLGVLLLFFVVGAFMLVAFLLELIFS